MVPAGNFQMIAKTLAGFEPVLANELRAMGATGVEQLHRAVSFYGDKMLLYRANLWLRTALRVLVPIKFFRAGDADELYEKARQIDWGQYMTVRDTFAIDAATSGDYHPHSQFAALRVKDAIADHFRDQLGFRPNVDLKHPTLRVNLFITGTEASLSLDASGESLHKRSYRIERTMAPLNEVLAAGMIMLTGWEGKSHFVDPMCGSGTLVIEAAWMAMNIAPGLRRDDFGFQRWRDFDERAWRGLIAEAKDKIVEPQCRIIGADVYREAIDIARRNITRAGLLSRTELYNRDFRKLTPPEEGTGIIITNPPYGERIEMKNLEQLYEDLGDTWKQKFQGWEAWIFTGNPFALKRLGLKAGRKYTLFNGPIECRFQQYELYAGSREKVETPTVESEPQQEAIASPGVSEEEE
jgi:putative N6-adenine-specific DNA methylase